MQKRRNAEKKKTIKEEMLKSSINEKQNSKTVKKKMGKKKTRKVEKLKN